MGGIDNTLSPRKTLDKGAREPTSPPSLKGKDLTLVPVSRKYLPLLHRWGSDPSSLYLWTSRRDILSEDEHAETLTSSRLREYYHVFLMVLNSKNEAVGFVYSYDISLADGFVFITLFLEPSNRKSGLGAKAAMLFCDYLFAYYPLRKIYCDIFEYNTKSLATLKNSGFEVEGALKKHRFFQGRYHTLYRLALYREKFFEKFGSMVHKIKLESE